jgi:hypothetical protein
MYSDRVVWWRCPQGPDHVWQDKVAAQSVHLRCAFCSDLLERVDEALLESPSPEQAWRLLALVRHL